MEKENLKEILFKQQWGFDIYMLKTALVTAIAVSIIIAIAYLAVKAI